MRVCKYLFFVFVLLVPGLSFAAGKAVINPALFDIGRIEEGRLYQYKMSVANDGDSDLIVSAPYVSCGCLRIISPKQKSVIPPGGKLDIEFSFNSAGYHGEVVNSIYFNTNDPQFSSVSIKVKADVLARQESFVDRFKQFGPLTILSASLADSINPCAFTVIVFFISFLSFSGYDKQAMIAVGCTFILAVFISYFLIGLGIFHFLKQLAIFQVLAKVVYLITALLALGLGLYSAYDAWIYHRTKDAEKVVLKLPGAIKSRIQGVIRDKVDIRLDKKERRRHLWALLVSALSCGFIVSILEFVCTGQLYLPTIVYILGVPALRLKALLYLFLYNIVFILPLLVILYLGVLGMTSQQFSAFFRKRLALVKLLTAVLFFALGASLLIFVKK
ncbi:MAG: DUF1573 domain-containing protein [Candidatus Omnitrophica bacterium]|nr:DUF1573 domain-containing protein [Candidatus Omnitrophota bacterium]MDD5236753.1 DUF1573 domain-containing protein [Candidatus Omnitrophota bacterium]MDD5610613.1 DUF1573 domain-containing protein [Candidatus Omnitrophota bacterium]